MPEPVALNPSEPDPRNPRPTNRLGKRAKVYPGKALLRDIVQAEVTGEHIEKKPVDNIDWDTKTLVEGEIESGRQTRRDGQLLVTGKLPSLVYCSDHANE